MWNIIEQRIINIDIQINARYQEAIDIKAASNGK